MITLIVLLSATNPTYDRPRNAINPTYNEAHQAARGFWRGLATGAAVSVPLNIVLPFSGIGAPLAGASLGYNVGKIRAEVKNDKRNTVVREVIPNMQDPKKIESMLERSDKKGAEASRKAEVSKAKAQSHPQSGWHKHWAGETHEEAAIRQTTKAEYYGKKSAALRGRLATLRRK